MIWRMPMLATFTFFSMFSLLTAAEPVVDHVTFSQADAPVLIAAAAPNMVPQKNPLPTIKPKRPELSAAELADKVQAFYEHTTDFSATFTQSYQYKAMARTQKSEGTVQVKKPGLMRWDYVKPHEKLFLLDGKALWIWDPSDKAVMVNREFSSDQLSAAVTFLWGQGKLSDEFEIQRVDKPAYGATVLELVPRKPQGGFTRLFFSVDPATGAVVTSVVIDSQGNENRIEFSDVKTNTGLATSRFQFTVPKGASVQEL